ncbi:MAG: LysE family translocator [Epsilonproteobacteria bacterium]|nr:LysE family translocator [Campylobacterota bacterium]
MNFSILSVFIPTFFFVSLTPGMCMTLSLSLGISIGHKKTLFMMLGELIGVAIVAISSVVGASAVMLRYPEIFMVLKYVGGAYLIYLGIVLWRNLGKMALGTRENNNQISNSSLALQGFITAVANPKGWAFFITLLPPFIDKSLPLKPQIFLLILIILTLEFICLNIYASGGKSLRKILQNRHNVQILNKISGILMMGVGIWLALQ